MPTIVDSLIVELALDPAKFTPKAKEAIEDLGKLEKANEKRSKGNVEGARHETDALRSLSKTAVGLFAIFTGITGIKEFITGTINAGAHFVEPLNPSDDTGWRHVGVRVRAIVLRRQDAELTLCPSP